MLVKLYVKKSRVKKDKMLLVSWAEALKDYLEISSWETSLQIISSYLLQQKSTAIER